MMNEIFWPEHYTPGTTDNFASNEIIRTNLTAEEVWPYLENTSEWPKYYKNASDIHFYNEPGPKLSVGSRFKFTTFGLLVEAEIVEYEPPIEGKSGRIAWHGWVEGSEEETLDVFHAWLIENLPGGRVRILTQESQIGNPAQQMTIDKPNPMINAHQDWIEGLANAAIKGRK